MKRYVFHVKLKTLYTPCVHFPRALQQLTPAHNINLYYLVYTLYTHHRRHRECIIYMCEVC